MTNLLNFLQSKLVVATAKADRVPEPGGNVPTSGQALIQTLTNVTNWVLGVLALVGGIFILVAAFQYLTAAGDAEKLGKAKNTLIYAIVAIAIGLLARGIPFIIQSITGIQFQQ